MVRCECYCGRVGCGWNGVLEYQGDMGCPVCGREVVIKTGETYDEYKDLHLDDRLRETERREQEWN